MPELGCAERYDVAIHYQGGDTEFLRLNGITELKWGRKLDDYSEATVTVTKALASAECCGQLAGVRTWAHEVSIYRDLRLIWQGPIVTKSEKRDTVTFEARDLLAWWDRRAIRPRLLGKHPDDPVPPGYDPERDGWPPVGTTSRPSPPKPQYHYWQAYDCGRLIAGMVRDAFWPLSQWDPGMWKYSYWWDKPDDVTVNEWIATGVVATTDRIYTGTTTVGDVARDVIKAGVDMYTIGRKIFVVSETWQRRNVPHRLSAEHFLDELEARENGLEAATRGFCSAGQPVLPDADPGPPENPGAANSVDQAAPIRGVVPGAWTDEQIPPSPWPPEDNPDTPEYEPDAWWEPDLVDPPGGIETGFGLIDRITESDQIVDPGPAQSMALGVRTHGFPPPMAVIVPDSARLSPNAPIHINQLVPGHPVLVTLADYCTPIYQTFRINEVEVEWSSDDVESVTVSFVSMNPPPGDET